MKVVLTRDVKDTGRMNEVVDVADGHALNFLIPKRFAVAATAGALKSAGTRQKAVADRKALDMKLVSERIAALADGAIVIKKKANEQGHLYDAVTISEIAAVVGIPEDAIDLARPIKEIGAHEIPVSFGDDEGAFTLTVEAE